MSATRRYHVVENGHPTTMSLSDQDAEIRGLTAADLAEPPTMATATEPKARTAADKTRTAPANKTR